MASYNGQDKRLQHLFEVTQPMTGATTYLAGKSGLVPAPSSSDKNKFLKGDGTWSETEDSGNTIDPTLLSGVKIADYTINGVNGSLYAPDNGGGGGLPGQGYTGSDLILRDANGNISGVWYIDDQGEWVEYTTHAPGGNSFSVLKNASDTVSNTYTITAEVNP